MSCTTSIKIHEPVPYKGDAGDSNGYLMISPEPDSPYSIHLRLPYKFSLATVSSDNIPAEGVRYRVAPTGDGLDALEPVQLAEAVAIPAHHTAEVIIETQKTHAAITFQLIKIL